MKLTTDARMITADGKDIGNLNRFVLDPKSKQVTDIVFEHGLLSKKEYVIPMQYVDRVEEDKVYLKPLPVEPEGLPRFTEDHYLITDEHALDNRSYINADPGMRMYYYYPPVYGPLGGGELLPPDEPQPPDTPTRTYNPPLYPPTTAYMHSTDAEPIIDEEEENVPKGTVALKEGAKVLSSNAKHVGDVEKVFVDPTDNKATHLLISKGLLLKERKLIPVQWAEHIYEKEVYLAVDEDFVNKLPDYKE